MKESLSSYLYLHFFKIKLISRRISNKTMPGPCGLAKPSLQSRVSVHCFPALIFQPSLIKLQSHIGAVETIQQACEEGKLNWSPGALKCV